MKSTINKRPKKAVKSKGPHTIIGKGIDIQDKFPKIIPIVLPDSHRKGHFFGFGTTRAGKTRVIESMISQDIEKGNSVVYVDPKGDIEILSKIVQKAFETGREEELFLVSPIYPQY